MKKILKLFVLSLLLNAASLTSASKVVFNIIDETGLSLSPTPSPYSIGTCRYYKNQIECINERPYVLNHAIHFLSNKVLNGSAGPLLTISNNAIYNLQHFSVSDFVFDKKIIYSQLSKTVWFTPDDLEVDLKFVLRGSGLTQNPLN